MRMQKRFTGRLRKTYFHCAPIASHSRPMRVLYEQGCLPLVARKWKADAVFFPGNRTSLVLAMFKIPSVVTIQDASPGFYQRCFPEYFPLQSARTIWLMRALATSAARPSAAILTVSNFSRDEVSVFTGVPKGKSFVVPPGCPPMTVTSENPAGVLRKYGIINPTF